VVFDETVYPFSKLNPNADVRLRSEILLLPKNSQLALPNGVDLMDCSNTNSHTSIVPANHLLLHEPSIENSTANGAGSNRDNIVYSPPLPCVRHDVDPPLAQTDFRSTPKADRPASSVPGSCAQDTENERNSSVHVSGTSPTVHMSPFGVQDSPIRVQDSVHPGSFAS
jgi:hypothetical protein